ncbi:MAG TPA: 2,3-bisphosphoglycerate-independent phosphoglycerate mutase, partial [Polyangiaceae bacterium]|nr:2,3-bisphosphoglycerate-independent phosphoglycerate mutase [Polyangiaceae bacterium]
MSAPRPLVLLILDGLGERPETADNAVALARTPELHALTASCPHTTIGASGPDVGLPPGQMGSSEVGHLNFGAGRVARMDISRIDMAVFDRSLGANEAIAKALAQAAQNSGKIHLFGLLSDGGVHSMNTHLYALIDAAHEAGVGVVVHAFLDGRDVQPGTAPAYLAELEGRLAGKGVIGTVSGRYYAMDRDNRWERVERAYRAIAHADAPVVQDATAGARASLESGTSDEFVEPFVVGDYAGVTVGRDVGLFFNFRPDRAREITRALAAPELSGFARGAAPFADAYTCMTQYDASLGLPV